MMREQPFGSVRWATTSPSALDLIETVSADSTRGPRLSDVTVMMVDDEPMMTDVIQTYLEEAGYRNFVPLNDPRNALALARAHRPGLLLLDLMMPDVSGFDVLEQVRADEVLRYTPVIVLTAAADAATKLRALELGATEFLAKPVDSSELVLRVRNSLVFKVYQDRLADEDPLTGLPNRRVFVERLRSQLARSAAEGGMLALLHLDLDRFRQVNDALGHAAGDRLLAAVADRLRGCTRRSEGPSGRADALLLARLGGDEFSLLLPRIADPQAASRVARRIVAAMAKPFTLEGQELFITPSIGISVFPGDGAGQESLLRNAGAAMEHAKNSGRNTYRFYAEELDRVADDRLSLETDLRQAIARGDQLLLHYQPKVDVASGRIVGAEALLRWSHPRLGLVAPDRFIPIAEESGLIVEIGEWVIESACAQIARWNEQRCEGIRVAVNVSRYEMVAGRLERTVREAMARHGVAPHQLVLELTESMLLDRADFTRSQVESLRSFGVELSIDDFGTGYSSMAYLKRFPLDELKIDRSFITGTPDDNTDVAIVRAIVVLAHSLGMRVVAEGVETEAQRALLQGLACDTYQGYLCSRPLPPDAFVAKLRQVNGQS